MSLAPAFARVRARFADRGRSARLGLVLVFVVAASTAACGTGGGSPDGEAVPDLEVTSLGGGEPLRLAELAEGSAVVNLWATWCVPCRREMPAVDAVDRATDDGDVRIVGVNIGDDPDDARRFVEELDVRFPQYLDGDGALHAELGATGIPATAFLDGGEVVGLHTGTLTADDLAAELDERFGLTVAVAAG